MTAVLCGNQRAEIVELASDAGTPVGHKSTHVTETVYRHLIVPAIRGGASVMDVDFNDDEDDTDEGSEKPRTTRF